MIDDEQRIIDPMAFIPVAERYNLMPAVDRLVISTAFARICAHRRARKAASSTHRWAINLSGASLSEDDFLEFVRTQFDAFGVPARRDLLRDHGDSGDRESRPRRRI